MLVEEIMNTNVISITSTTSIAHALKLLQKHKIRHLPVIDNENKVIGIVSDRDVRDASPSIIDENADVSILDKEIASIMTTPVITVHPLDFVEEIAQIFYDQEFASVPVVSNKKLVGMVTEKDMLYTLIQLTRTNIQSSRIEVKVKHRPGILPEITNIFGKRKINIVSLLIYPYKTNSDYRILVIRFQSMNPAPIIHDIKSAGFELISPNNILEPRL